MAVSVYLSNKRILAAVGTGTKKKLSISRLCVSELSEGCMINGVITSPDQFLQEFSEFWSRFRLPKKGVELVVDSGQFIIRRLTVPLLNGRKLEKLIKSEFGEVGTIEKPVYDYMTVDALDKKDNMADVIAVAADKNFLESYAEIMGKAGLKISSIIPAQCSNLRLMEACAEFKDKTCILAYMDGANLNCMLVEDAKYVYSSKARLFQEPGTDAYLMEVMRTFSGIKQFHATRRRERNISAIYFGGITPQELEDFQGLGLMIDMNITFFPEEKNISLPKKVDGVLGAGIETDAAVSSFIPVLGNLIKR